MTRNNKFFFNLLCVVTLIYLIIFSFINNPFESNLSRIGNSSYWGYFSLLLLSIMFGLIMHISLKKQYLNKLSYLGLISMLIGSVVPYNYLDTNAISSNLHLIGAYLSLGITLLCELYSLFYFEKVNSKLNKTFKYSLLVIGALTIYQYGTYMYINGFIELIYLSFIIVSQMIIVKYYN